MIMLTPYDVENVIVPALETDLIEANYENYDVIGRFMVVFRERYASYSHNANIQIFVQQDGYDKFIVTPLADDWEDTLKVNQNITNFLMKHVIRRCNGVCKARIDSNVVLTSNLKNLVETIQLCKEIALLVDVVCLYDEETN